MIASVSLNINGYVHTLDVDPETPLLYVLSDDLQLRGPNTLPLGIHVPSIESVLINRPAAKASGAGETAITLVAAAIGNAIFRCDRRPDSGSAFQTRSRACGAVFA